MKSMKFPSRPAPSVEEGKHKNNSKSIPKKPRPPRPPPPNFNKIKSQSAWNLNLDNVPSLIEWSPPTSPKNHTAHTFGGSVSSSFSSSTSSLASSKKSFEYESITQNPWNNSIPFPFPTYGLQAKNEVQQQVVPPKVQPTIIRAQPGKKNTRLLNGPSSGSSTPRDASPLPNHSQNILEKDVSLFCVPMPTIPPPSPPKEVSSEVMPFGIALYDYNPTQADDLKFQENDIVYLIKKINNEWLYGRVDDREGMFPANFIDVHVPLPEESNVATALYKFHPELPTDLALEPGQKVTVLKRLSPEWLFGEANGKSGQFPANFINRIPNNI